MKEKCKAKDCQKEHYAKGLCFSHYRKQRYKHKVLAEALEKQKTQ